MIVAHHKAHDVRRDQPDEVDQANVGHDHRAGKAGQQHIDQREPLHVDAEALRRFLAAEQSVVVPAVGKAVDDQQKDDKRHPPQVAPARAAKIAEGPVDQRGKRDFVGKILHQGRRASEHGADGHARKHDALGGDLPEAAQRQNDGRHCQRPGEGQQRNRPAAGAGNAKADDGKRRAEGRSLRHAERRGRGQRIVQDCL